MYFVLLLLSAPEPLTFHIFNFFSETDEQNSMKLTGSKISTSSTQFVFFRPIGKTRWPPWPLIGWDIFSWKEFNKTWQEERSKRPLPSLFFSGQSEKQGGRPGLWLAKTFLTSSLKPLNGIQWNLKLSKISTSSTKFMFFGLIGKNKMAALTSDWQRHFPLKGIQRNLIGSKISMSSTKIVFFELIEINKIGLWLAETFSTSSLKALNEIQWNLIGSKISKSSTKFVFIFGRSEKLDGCPGL